MLCVHFAHVWGGLCIIAPVYSHVCVALCLHLCTCAQTSMEEVQYLLRIPQRKPWGSMASDVASCLAPLQSLEGRAALLTGVPPDQLESAKRLLDDMSASLTKADEMIRKQNADLVSVYVADVLKSVSGLELLQAPGGCMAAASRNHAVAINTHLLWRVVIMLVRALVWPAPEL